MKESLDQEVKECGRKLCSLSGELAGNVTSKNHLEITEKSNQRGEITTAKSVMSPGGLDADFT